MLFQCTVSFIVYCTLALTRHEKGSQVPSPTIYSYTILDSAGVKATAGPFYVAYDAATETVAALTGNFAALGGLVDLITDGQIVDGRIIIDVAPDPGWKAAPVADSIVERTGLFNFKPLDSKYVQGADIPAISLAVLDAKSRVTLTNTNVINFITSMTQATGIGGSNTVFANNKFLLALRTFVDVATTFRKHRRKMTRNTIETP